MGFPLITIIREGNEIVAAQERYLVTVESTNNSVRSLPKSKYDYKWYVPLTYFTSNDTETVKQVWMNMTDGKRLFILSHSSHNYFFSALRIRSRNNVDQSKREPNGVLQGYVR